MVKSCRQCVHFYPCAYNKSFRYKFEELMYGVGIEFGKDVKGYVYKFLSKYCKYFNKDGFCNGWNKNGKL